MMIMKEMCCLQSDHMCKHIALMLVHILYIVSHVLRADTIVFSNPLDGEVSDRVQGRRGYQSGGHLFDDVGSDYDYEGDGRAHEMRGLQSDHMCKHAIIALMLVHVLFIVCMCECSHVLRTVTIVFSNPLDGEVSDREQGRRGFEYEYDGREQGRSSPSNPEATAGTLFR